MLTSILNYLIEGIASAAVAVCGAVFGNIGSGLSFVENLIPGLGTLDGILTLIGASIVAAGLYLRLFGAAASSLTGQPADHPVRIAARALTAGAGVALSGPLCRYVLSASDRVFGRILESGDLPADPSALTLPQLIGTVFTELIPVASAGSVLLHFILTLLMAWNVIKIALLTLEHVLLIVVCVHLSPLLAGFSVSPSTGDIVAGFARSFAGQCLTLLASAWGFRAFSLTLSRVWTLSLNGGISLLQMTALVLFTSLIASLDGLFARFGFRTLPTSETVRGGVANFSRSIENAVSRTVVRAAAGSVENAVLPVLQGSRPPVLRVPAGEAAGSSPAVFRSFPGAGKNGTEEKGPPGPAPAPAHGSSPDGPDSISPVREAVGRATDETARQAAGKETTGEKKEKGT